MKKLVLTILSVFVMLLFIFLNYLLWDRDKKIDIDKDNQASIAALGREIKTLESMNNSLKDRTSKFESDLKSAEEKITDAQQEKVKLNLQISQRNETINQLKQIADIKVLTDSITKWGEAMEKAQYDIAYQMMLPNAVEQTNLDEFTKQCKGKIKSFKLTSIKPVFQNNPEDKKGDIQFKIDIDVKRIPDSGKFVFDEGVISKNIILTFSKAKSIWLISEIQ